MSYENGINTLQQLFPQTSTTNVSQTQGAGNAPASAAGKTDSAAGMTGAPNDQASLSTLGGLAAAGASGADDVRMDRVSALQAVINGGTYNVPSSDVADSLMNQMLQS